jgi:hypothetical protein
MEIAGLLAHAFHQQRPIRVAAQQQRGVDDLGRGDAGRIRRPRLAQHIDAAERQRMAERIARLDVEFLQALAHARAAAGGEVELGDGLRPQLQLAAVRVHLRRIGAGDRDGANVVGHHRIAALRQHCCERGFAGARRTAEQYRLAVDAHRARMQHDLLALMQQDAEHGAEQKDRDIGGIATRLLLEDDLASVVEQEARHAGNAQQELLAGDLPGRPGGAGVGERIRHCAGPDRHIGQAATARHGIQSGQCNLAVDDQSGDAIKMHVWLRVSPSRSS